MQVRTNDGVIAVVEDGSGPAIVLLHGFLGDASLWDRQRAELAKRARVIVPDLRGCGNSSVTPGPYLMESLAGDLATVLDALAVEQAVVVGHSLGGYVAMAFFRMYAERVAALGLIASRVQADSGERVVERRQLAEIIARDGIAPLVDANVQNFLGERTWRERPDIVETVRKAVARSSPIAAIAYLEGMSQRVASDDLLEDIAVPTTVVSGRDDRMIPDGFLRDAAERIVGARYVEIAECGHMVMLEAAAQTTDVVAELLDRVSRTSRAEA